MDAIRATGVALSIIKILIALLMMGAGIDTAFFTPINPESGALGFLYGYKIFLVITGAIFFGSGLALFVGKVFRMRRLTGWGLMAIFCCFLFSALLQAAAYGVLSGAWMGNFIAAVLVALLYLWWRYKVRLAEYHALKREYDRLIKNRPA